MRSPKDGLNHHLRRTPSRAWGTPPTSASMNPAVNAAQACVTLATFYPGSDGSPSLALLRDAGHMLTNAVDNALLGPAPLPGASRGERADRWRGDHDHPSLSLRGVVSRASGSSPP